MTINGWEFIQFTDGWKPHAAPKVLVEKLLTELAARGAVVRERKDCTEFSMDHGGMAVQGRPYVEFWTAGLAVSFPAEHVEEFARLLRKAPLRTFADGTPYVKFHCHWNALVLTTQQREVLVKTMESATPASNAAAERFYESWKSSSLKPSKPQLDDSEVAEAEKIAEAF